MSENASVTANLGPQHLGAARDTVAQVLEEAKRQGASAAEAQLSLAQGCPWTSVWARWRRWNFTATGAWR